VAKVYSLTKWAGLQVKLGPLPLIRIREGCYDSSRSSTLLAENSDKAFRKGRSFDVAFLDPLVIGSYLLASVIESK